MDLLEVNIPGLRRGSPLGVQKYQTLPDAFLQTACEVSNPDESEQTQQGMIHIYLPPPTTGIPGNVGVETSLYHTTPYTRTKQESENRQEKECDDKLVPRGISF